MAENLKIHNKSDKPDNVVKKEYEIQQECEAIEKELPNWLRGFFLYLKSNDLPMTRLSYLRELRFFCNYLVKETQLAENVSDIKKLQPQHFNEISGMDINIFIDYCRSYVVKDKFGNDVVYTNNNAALSHKKSVVSVFFKYLYRDGFVEKNITDAFDPIRMPKPGEREIKALKDDEVMRMLDAASQGTGLTKHELSFWERTKNRDLLILLLFVTYGLRLSELEQLNISSFNFDRGEFKIYRKRGKESLMPINHTISDAFHAYVNQERMKEDELEDEFKDALLLSLQGKRLTQRQIREIVKKYSSIGMGTTRANGYSPHKLRATAATSLIGRGNSIYDVQALMDHDNVTTTQLYAAHKENTKRDLIKNFEWGEDMQQGEKYE